LILWDEKELSAVKDKELVEKAKKKRSDLADQFDKVKQFFVDNK
jgi:hypothetical protein